MAELSRSRARQAFGTVLVTHWGLLLVIAGGITGGLVEVFTRRWKRIK